MGSRFDEFRQAVDRLHPALRAVLAALATVVGYLPVLLGWIIATTTMTGCFISCGVPRPVLGFLGSLPVAAVAVAVGRTWYWVRRPDWRLPWRRWGAWTLAIAAANVVMIGLDRGGGWLPAAGVAAMVVLVSGWYGATGRWPGSAPRSADQQAG